MSHLQKALAEYIELRRSVGFKIDNGARLLPRFVDYLDAQNIDTITCDAALAWAMQPPDNRDLWAVRLSLVRCFARHMQAFDPRTEVPPIGLLRHRRRRATPYVYSEEDIERLLEAARGLLHPLLHAWTYSTLIGLLASTGMRRGEIIRLDREDINWEHGLLVVHKTKFGKSRELPLHETTVDALEAYARIRDQSVPFPKSSSFFVSLAGTRLMDHRVHVIFSRLARRIGLKPRSSHCRPRIHDLRHTFAVRTMLDWYRAGTDVESKLPLLSTYLGHFNPSSTYWYMSATPELLSLAAQRFERAWEVSP